MSDMKGFNTPVEVDAQRICISESHGSGTFALILLIILLSIVDTCLTLDLVIRGAEEVNPIMAYYLHKDPFAFFGVKYFLTCISIIVTLSIKDAYLFKTRFQGKILFVFHAIVLALVIHWELYLIITNFR